MNAGPDTTDISASAVGTPQGVNQDKGQNQMTRENTVNVPVEPDSGLLSVIASMVRRIAVPTSIDPDEVYFDNGHARQIYKAITDAAPLHEGEGEPVAWRWQWPGQNTWGYADYNLHPDAETVQPLYAAPPPSVEVFGSSAEGADTHRAAETAVVTPEDWWIEWSGGPRPVDRYTLVTIRRRDGREVCDKAFKFDWTNENYVGVQSDIVAYRIEAVADTPPPAASVSPGTSVASEPNPSVEVEGLREALERIAATPLLDDGGAKRRVGQIVTAARAALSRKQEPGVPTPGGEG